MKERRDDPDQQTPLSAALTQMRESAPRGGGPGIDDGERTRIWTPDGAETSPPSRGGRELRERAWWDGEVLVLESSGDRYEMRQRLRRPDADTLDLDVSLTISGGAEPVQATLVYRQP